MDDLIVPYPPLPRALELIAGFSDKQFQILKEAVTGPEAFDRTLARCRALALKLGSDAKAQDAFSLLTSLRFLYDSSRDWGDTSAGLREFLEFAGLLRKLGPDEGQGLQRLAELIAQNRVVERRRKLRWLRTGILDTAVSFSSFVDLRPNVTADRARIEEFVPVVILGVVVDSERGSERSHVFQLTQEGLSKLKAAIEDVDKKLALLRTDTTLAARLLTLAPGDTVDDDDDEEP